MSPWWLLLAYGIVGFVVGWKEERAAMKRRIAELERELELQ